MKKYRIKVQGLKEYVGTAEQVSTLFPDETNLYLLKMQDVSRVCFKAKGIPVVLEEVKE